MRVFDELCCRAISIVAWIPFVRGVLISSLLAARIDLAFDLVTAKYRRDERGNKSSSRGKHRRPRESIPESTFYDARKRPPGVPFAGVPLAN